MSEFQVIQTTLTRAARRRRWDRAWRGLWTGLWVGSAFWLLALVAFKLLPLPYWTLAVAGAIGLACVGAGFLLGGWRAAALGETARWIDIQQHLKERLSTAWELGPNHGEWSQLLLQDAARHLEGLEVRRLLPLQLPRSSRWVLLLLAVAAGLGFVPEYRSPAYLRQQAETATIREVGRQLAELTRRSLEQRPPTLEPTQKAMLSVAELAQRLDRTPPTRSEALRELANAAERLSQEARELARNPALKPLERAARQSASGTSTARDDLQKQIEALRKSLGNDKATPDALDKLKAGVQQAQKTAAGLQNQDPAAARAVREQLAQGLASLAQQASDLGHPLASLEDAIQALSKHQIDQVLKDLEVAATDLDKLRDLAHKLSQLRQQAERLGRDLAEQLESGQADAARQTLEKMVNQLQSGQLTGQQLDQILDEVSRAVAPAGEYGKVQDFLKQAVRQMQQAKQGGSTARQCKADAAQALAAAAKELEKLAQEMADIQALAASLDALGRAQQAIASGQGWSQCMKAGQKCDHCNGRGCARCKGTGWGPGGNPRSAAGVGTWAEEETGWLYYSDIPPTPVDNSGVQRPDMEAKGVTDRGPGTLSDALKPDKVKGKLAPGGPMPSITLKGVSITGRSTVQLEEAAAAAQSEARSALNQDLVPRPYQNAVKDYFDDFKP